MLFTCGAGTPTNPNPHLGNARDFGRLGKSLDHYALAPVYETIGRVRAGCRTMSLLALCGAPWMVTIGEAMSSDDPNARKGKALWSTMAVGPTATQAEKRLHA